MIDKTFYSVGLDSSFYRRYHVMQKGDDVYGDYNGGL